MVPADRDLSVRAFTVRDEPAFALRHPHPMLWARGKLYRPAKPGNEIETDEFEDIEWTGRANRQWYLRMRGSSEWFAFNHRPQSHRWDGRFAATNPEYFGLKPDGKRDIKANQTSRFYGHLCYSEEGVFQETMKDIEAFFTGQPAESRSLPSWPPNASYGETFSLLPHDAWRGCHCERCIVNTRDDGAEWTKLSGVFWPFAERVARETEGRCPGKVLTCLAYSRFAEIPEGVRLPDNVLVGCCPAFLNKTFSIVNPETYQELMALVERLDAANGMPLFYWFHHLFKWRGPQHYGAPMLLPHFMARFIGDLSKHGRLFFLETDYNCMIQEYLTRYVFMRATYDPTIDVDALMHDHVQTYYGPAAAIIEPMLLDIEKRSERMAAASPRGNNNGVNAQEIWWDYFPGDVVSGYRESADRALGLAKGGPYEEHVRLFSKYFIGLMEKGYGRFRYQAGPSGVAIKKDCPLPPSLAPLKDRVVEIYAEDFVYSPDVARSHAKLVAEPASVTGRAARVLIEKIEDPRRERYYFSNKGRFTFRAYDRQCKKVLKPASFKAADVPDAGYNLFALKDVTLPADARLILFWSGHLQVRLNALVKPGETGDVYVSARFDGPGFPHGNPETQDVIYIDRVFLLRKDLTP